MSIGGAWAASKLISGKQVRNGSLTGADIKKRSIPLDRLKGKLPAGAVGPAGRPGAIGPAGGTGPAGATGDRGEAGVAAPASAVYQATKQYNPVGVSVPSGSGGIAHTLQVPAGSYAATANVTLKNASAAAEGLVCDLLLDESLSTGARAVAEAEPGHFATLVVSLAFTSAQPSTVKLRCIRNGVTGTVTRNASTLTAVQAGSIVATP